MTDIKKNSYRFSLQFNSGDPRHVRAVDILNRQGRGTSQFIVNCVLHYMNCSRETADPVLQEQQMERLVELTVRKTLAACDGQIPAPPRLAQSIPRHKPEPEETTPDSGLSSADNDFISNALNIFP